MNEIQRRPGAGANPSGETNSPPAPAPRNRDTRGTILVAEDDKMVQASVERVLVREGYTVLTADDGGEALELLEQCGGEVDLFLTDVVLPRIPGPAVARFAVENFRRMAVLFVSGYPRDERQTGPSQFPDASFLAKPFTPEALLMTVRTLVEFPPAPRKGPAGARS